MAKVTITITDEGENRVKAVCEPSFEKMLGRVAKGYVPTQAESYLLVCMKAMRDQSKMNSRNADVIEIPKPKGIM